MHKVVLFLDDRGDIMLKKKNNNNKSECQNLPGIRLPQLLMGGTLIKISRAFILTGYIQQKDATCLDTPSAGRCSNPTLEHLQLMSCLFVV